MILLFYIHHNLILKIFYLQLGMKNILFHSFVIHFLSLSYHVICTVAPNKESTIEPIKPQKPPNMAFLHMLAMSKYKKDDDNVEPVILKDTIPVNGKDTPINKPPKMDATVPKNETPPLVPGGTVRKKKDVINLGELLLNTPNSEAQVSAAQHA